MRVLTTNQKGVAAEQAIVFEAAIELGVGVFAPLDDERYDLVLDLRPRCSACSANGRSGSATSCSFDYTMSARARMA